MFSPGSVTNVEVFIDEVHAGKAKHEEGPLYVLSWRPEKYSRGLHAIRVVVQVITNELHHKKTCLLHMRKKEENLLPNINHGADQGPCFPYIDTTIPLLSKSESSNL